MVVLKLTFPAGRYHATPWDRHVNEGVVEWPPSPWRILRALVATWYRKGPRVPEERIRRLLDRLASAPPRYRVPRAVAAHTRHYMPLAKPDKTTKVLDAFLHLAEPAEVFVSWPIQLGEEDRALLEELFGGITYLGRAESWADGTLVEEVPESADTFQVVPAEEVTPTSAECEDLVPLLTPVPAEEYSAWREELVQGRREEALVTKRARAVAKEKDPERVRLSAKEAAKAEAGIPARLLDALMQETTDLRKAGWNLPPGSRFVDYARPTGIDDVAPSPFAPPRRRSLPTVARYAIVSAVLPRLTEAVSVAERFRTALLARSDAAPVFSGKDAEGVPLEDHGHAFFLPEGNGPHGRITHLTLYAKRGFDDAARRALDTLRKVWGRGGHDLGAVLLGVGRPDDFVGRSRRSGDCTLLWKSRIWNSRTPFVATRHPKSRANGTPKLDANGLQLGSPEQDLRRLLREGGFPEPVRVVPVATTNLGRPVRWLEFRTVRKKGPGRRAKHSGAGFRIEFPTEVCGPIAVGYGAHFGLGMFLPEP